MRAARHLDLVLDGGLNQQAHEVQVAEHRALGDDRPRDLDVVQRQDVDQGGRSPGRVGELLRQAAANVAP